MKDSCLGLERLSTILQFSGYELGFHYLLDEKTKKQDLRE